MAPLIATDYVMNQFSYFQITSVSTEQSKQITNIHQDETEETTIQIEGTSHHCFVIKHNGRNGDHKARQVMSTSS
ncbi:hypothetical protein VTN49DRAFT_2366 [Thermomyces lanuginosus]|uniref:uncharacterized protein n=1 Tax=Thermomyces lanuginosus TaxID=5541 RepID=UPI003742E991